MGGWNRNGHTALSFHSYARRSNLDFDRDIGRLQLSRDTVSEEPGIWPVQVQLSKVIEMLQRPLFRHVDNTAANLEMAERLLRIVGKQRHVRVGAHVLFLAKPAHGVDQHIVSLAVAPD